MNRPKRPLIRQEFYSFALLVGVTPTPLSQSIQQAGISGAYTTIAISNPTGAAAVLIGGANVSPAVFNGLELIPGTTSVFVISNERQLYEVQGPLVDAQCSTPDVIPFVVWDVSNFFLVSTVAHNCGIGMFKATFY